MSRGQNRIDLDRRFSLNLRLVIDYRVRVRTHALGSIAILSFILSCDPDLFFICFKARAWTIIMSKSDHSPHRPRKLRRVHLTENGILREKGAPVEVTSQLAPPSFLRYYPPLRVLLCYPCQHAVAGDQLRTHLAKAHPEQHRNGGKTSILQACATLDLLPRTAVAMLPGPQPPIPGLPWSREGLQCLQCPSDHPRPPYICLTWDSMRKHLRTSHAVSQYPAPGRPYRRQKRPSVELFRQGVACQRLFLSGSDSSYFEVLPKPFEEGEKPRSIEERGPSALPRAVQTRLEELQVRPDTLTIAPLGAREANPWLQRTGWADYLQGLSLAKLAALLDPPRPDEPVLLRWEQALERIVADSRAAILQEEISVFD